MCAHHPAFQLRIARERESEVWIQLDSALIKLLALFQFCRVLKSTGKIMRLHESQVSLAVFGWLPRHLRFLAGDSFACSALAILRARSLWIAKTSVTSRS